MALSTRAIKGKIKSVSNIKKITKAMEMVSASKMRKAVAKNFDARTFGLEALNLMHTLSQERGLDHPLFHKRDSKREIVIMVTSNKGLCGGYNASIIKKFKSYVEEKKLEKRDVSMIAIGKYSARFADREGIEKLGSFDDIGDYPSIEDVENVIKLVIETYLEGGYGKVVFVYSRYVSALIQKPVYRSILPVREVVLEKIFSESDQSEEDPDLKHKENSSLYIFEPSEEEVLDEVIPRLIEAVVYQGVLESIASEHSARMIAMKNATENAGELVDDLTLYFNRARQAAVTREISEISAGAEALND